MHTKNRFFAAPLFLIGVLFSLAAFAEEPAAPAAASAQPAGNLASQYTDKGADTCIK